MLVVGFVMWWAEKFLASQDGVVFVLANEMQ